MTEHDQEVFHYTYSAIQQQDVMKIRKKYAQPEETKLEKLRRLDRSATQKGAVSALTVGIIGTLVMGTGMSCAMVGSAAAFVPGIVIGCVGIAMVVCAYPLYARITEKQRKKIAPEILKLTDELMQ